MVSETDVIRLIAECLDVCGHPDVKMVSTFGTGTTSGSPGVRVDHPDGSRTYLVPLISATAEGQSARVGFVDLVMNAISAADQSMILRTGSVVTVDSGDPTGLTVTTVDGWDLVLRAVSMGDGPPPVARQLPVREGGG